MWRPNHKRIDQVTHPWNIKGRQAEWTAKAHFEALGYSVEINMKVAGSDLCVLKDGTLQTVEVKSAIGMKRERTWIVDKVKPNRVGDDLMAIVLPDGRVHVCAMHEHLAACSPSGFRTITKLIRPVRPQAPRGSKLKSDPPAGKRRRARAEIIAILRARGEDVA